MHPSLRQDHKAALRSLLPLVYNLVPGALFPGDEVEPTIHELRICPYITIHHYLLNVNLFTKNLSRVGNCSFIFSIYRIAFFAYGIN